MYFNQQDFTQGYFIVPESVTANPGTKAWVVVEVHGAGGLKEEHRGEWLVELLDPTPVIVLVPSFTDGYQSGDGKWARQLMDHFEAIQNAHNVHDTMFLHGHSGGAQFVHRFAFNEPDLVAGVSAHSAGSWAVAGGYGKINPKAKNFPWLISCGDQDTKVAWKGYVYNRIEWYELFAQELVDDGFVVHPNVWSGVGHGVEKHFYEHLLKECFLLATKGELPSDKGWKGDVQRMAGTKKKKT